MEQNNNNTEFEHFLRDSIADFIMIPQRKVWYGIYNHLHPQKKWPSIAVCFCILVSIMHIGIINNKNINTDIQQAKNEMQNKQTTYAAQIIKDNTVPILSNTTTSVIIKEKLKTSISNSKPTDISSYNVENDFANTITSYSEAVFKSKIKIGIQNVIASEDEIIALKENTTESVITAEKENNAAKNNNTKVLETFTTKNNTENKIISAEKKADVIVENNFSAYNSLVKLPKQRKKNEISYYITPSIGYRILEQNDALKSNNPGASVAAITNNYGLADVALEDKKAFNFEIGAAVTKSISKKIRLQAGIQVNYTNYISKATSLSHPTQSIVAQRSSNTGYKNMDYASAPGNISLNKTTLQIAIPVGIKHTVIGNEKIKWNVGATIQPALVIGGSGYVLSADKQYYVTEKDLLNRFNVSASAETFISIKTAKGIILNVGPQFRYQLTSTYKKTYNFSEKLYNVGLKIGVSTTL